MSRDVDFGEDRLLDNSFDQKKVNPRFSLVDFHGRIFLAANLYFADEIQQLLADTDGDPENPHSKSLFSLLNQLQRTLAGREKIPLRSPKDIPSCFNIVDFGGVFSVVTSLRFIKELEQWLEYVSQETDVQIPKTVYTFMLQLKDMLNR